MLPRIRKILEFWNSSRPLRGRFGAYRGIRMALQLRHDYSQPRGSRFLLSVPGLVRPVLLRAGTTDGRVAREVLLAHPLDIPLEVSPRFIVDAGANIGLASVFLASRYPGATIVSLEVEAGNFAMLTENVRGLGAVTPLHRGLWSGRGYLKIVNPKASSWTFRVAEAAAIDPDAVEGLGVSDILHDFGVDHVDLLKMDIEGAEYAVFSGPDLSWLDRVGVLVVELHDRLRPGCTDALERALAGRPHRREASGEYAVIRFASKTPGPRREG